MSDPVRGETFKPGEECKRSGIYRVIHDTRHTEEHEVTCVGSLPHGTAAQCDRVCAAAGYADGATSGNSCGARS
jgi:negative regulator of sigma E activity